MIIKQCKCGSKEFEYEENTITEATLVDGNLVDDNDGCSVDSYGVSVIRCRKCEQEYPLSSFNEIGLA